MVGLLSYSGGWSGLIWAGGWPRRRAGALGCPVARDRVMRQEAHAAAGRQTAAVLSARRAAWPWGRPRDAACRAASAGCAGWAQGVRGTWRLPWVLRATSAADALHVRTAATSTSLRGRVQGTQAVGRPVGRAGLPAAARQAARQDGGARATGYRRYTALEPGKCQVARSACKRPGVACMARMPSAARDARDAGHGQGGPPCWRQRDFSQPIASAVSGVPLLGERAGCWGAWAPGVAPCGAGGVGDANAGVSTQGRPVKQPPGRGELLDRAPQLISTPPTNEFITVLQSFSPWRGPGRGGQQPLAWQTTSI